jgi:hypothetical protein
MAKVMVSRPDDLLAQVDAEAARRELQRHDPEAVEAVEAVEAAIRRSR